MSDNASQRATPASAAKSLGSTYVHLRDDKSAADVEVTPTFWQELGGGERPGLDAGRLLMQLDCTEDWPTWEMHPAGDEVVLLVAGTVEFVLEVDGREQCVTLQAPGDFVRVPRGVWHTARVSSPCSLVFVTPGEGTQNRPR
jgi:mannose-6-phosphate isomerase-like protein (cupin superfamily)